MKFTLIMMNLTCLFCIYESSTLRQFQWVIAKHQLEHIRLSSKGKPSVKQKQLSSKPLNDQSMYFLTGKWFICLLLDDIPIYNAKPIQTISYNFIWHCLPKCANHIYSHDVILSWWIEFKVSFLMIGSKEIIWFQFWE